ncbi:MAG TPA: aspartyl protease family protein, partial [Candidatus Baltobacteraceae bacterium]|nr:aspartyl protease family protein [Candidatus Baltobacteraceae bacterium]
DLYESGDDYVETYRQGPYTWAEGSFNGTQWRKDDNGVVTLVSGFAQTANPFTATLSQPSAHDSSLRVLGITTTQPACVVVQLAPQPGLVQQRYYDAKTFLLRRVVTSDYQAQPWTFDYGDLRTRYGVTFPQTITYHDAQPENASVMRALTFEPVAASAVHTAVPITRPLFTLPSTMPVTVPADFTPHGIIVRVTIHGRGLDFELDSGASDLVLDAGVARELGLAISDVRKESFSGDYSEGRSIASDFSIGSLRAQNVAITTIPFSRMVGERKVVGLLGGDFFASERVAVNFKNDTLAISPASTDAPAGTWSAMPIQVDDSVPRMHAKFNAVDGAFVVDLGADVTMLYPHFFRQFHPKNKGDVLGQIEGVAGEGVDFRQYTFSRFDLGDMAFADVSAAVTSGTKFEDIDYDGLLGRNVLDNFNLVFDYPNGKLYLQSLVQ